MMLYKEWTDVIKRIDDVIVAANYILDSCYDSTCQGLQIAPTPQSVERLRSAIKALEGDK